MGARGPGAYFPTDLVGAMLADDLTAANQRAPRTPDAFVDRGGRGTLALLRTAPRSIVHWHR